MLQKERLDNIKMIALDLDGTTLTRSGLTRRTRATLEEAIRRGIHVVIATGRAYESLPETVHEIEGLEYIITSNGAHLHDAPTGDFIYSNYIDAETIDEVWEVLSEAGFVVEVFTEGRAYIDKSVYDDIAVNGSDYLAVKYIMRTRNPVEGIFDFLKAHREKIENINIHFRHQEDRLAMWQRLDQLEHATVTSSTEHNVEIGGETASKATALAEVCRRVGLDLCQIMACGDSPNDKAMMEAAGLAVAMGNATDDVKAIADYVTLTADEEGVAYAIRTLLFGEEKGVAEPKKGWLSKLFGK